MGAFTGACLGQLIFPARSGPYETWLAGPEARRFSDTRFIRELNRVP